MPSFSLKFTGLFQHRFHHVLIGNAATVWMRIEWRNMTNPKLAAVSAAI